MYVSNVIVRFAPRMASSMAGKISSPFRSTSKRLSGRMTGPSRTPSVRGNCGSATAYRCSRCRLIGFSPVIRLSAARTATSVTATVARMLATFARVEKPDRDPRTGLRATQCVCALRRLLHAHMRLGNRITGGAERIADGLVGVEIDLPVMIGVRVGANGQHGTALVEVDDFDIRRRLADDIRNLRERFLEPAARVLRIDAMGELRETVHSPIGAGGEILDRVGEGLVVAHRRHDHVRGGYRPRAEGAP